MLPNYKSLSDADLGDLARAGDLHARDTLALRYQPWAWKVCRRYDHMGVDLEDLFAEGMFALLEAAANFDGQMAGFKSFSRYYLAKRLGLAIGRGAYTASLSYNACLVQAKCHKARGRLSARLHRDPTLEEVAAEAGVEERWVRWVEQITRAGVLELDKPVGDEGGEGRAPQLDPWGVLPGDSLEERDRTAAVARAMAELDPRHAKVLRAVFGFEGQPDRSLSEIGIEFGCTKERVRQLREKSLTRLRAQHADLLSEYHPAPPAKAAVPTLDPDTAALLARERELYRQRQAGREGS